MFILSLCDATGSWSEPYRSAGFRIKQVDLTLGQDVRLMELPRSQVYGVLAAPPCTHLSLSGAQYWEKKGGDALLQSMSVVDACLRLVAITRPKFWCLENPVGRLRRFLGPPTMIFDPYQYAGLADDPKKEAYTKKTLLWGNFNTPEKHPVNPVASGDSPIMKASGLSAGAVRSVTPSGFARAFFEANSRGCQLDFMGLLY